MQIKETVLRKLSETEVADILETEVPADRKDSLEGFRANLRRCPYCNFTHPEYPVNDTGVLKTPYTFEGGFDYAVQCPVTEGWLAVRERGEHETLSISEVLGN